MKSLKKLLMSVGIVIILAGLGIAYVLFYPYIHARTVMGEVNGVKQLLENTAFIAGSADPTNKIYSFAVGVKEHATQEIVTGSSEDRQWGVVREGQCVEAVFYPYPPWNLQKSGTYYNVRVKRLYDNCEMVQK
ncbi:MAG: hypothetical protein JNL11_05450 [Bdellovibrionaceae bacterium]|nr:hypothetical protein [Pseudobdellovibrionaceae bacterium]